MSGRVICFYLGTFLTSFGSLLFTMGISSFFTLAGIQATTIGVTVGIHRFAGIASGALFGPRIDLYDSRKVILWTELFAALASAGLILSWIYRENSLVPFWLFTGFRALVMGVQSTSRNRLIKLLSGRDSATEASFVIWLNKVTQGAHAISALAALVLVTHGRFEYAMAIDGLTFIFGGLTTWWLPDLEAGIHRTVRRLHFFSAVRELAILHSETMILDILLSLAASGSILLMVKLSHGDARQIIFLNLVFGACIWLSSVFAHSLRWRRFHAMYWLTMAAGGVGLAIFGSSGLLMLAFYLVMYLGYWALYHKYTVEIQTGTPQESIGAVMAARGLVAALVLSSGELAGGFIEEIISLPTELLLRVSVCAFAIFIAWKRDRK